MRCLKIFRLDLDPPQHKMVFIYKDGDVWQSYKLLVREGNSKDLLFVIIVKVSALWDQHRHDFGSRDFHNVSSFWIIFSLDNVLNNVSSGYRFYRTQVSLGSDLWVRFSQTKWATFADLTDETLAGEDINSIPTDNADRAFQGNVAMQVMPTAIWWPNLELTQVAPSGGQTWN